MESWLLLDVVILEGSTIFELLTSKDESLLIWRNTFFVLDFSLDVFYGVRLFDIEGDGLSCEGLHENLHSTSESEDQMKGRLFLNIVILESSAIFELFTSEDESLLIWGNTFFVLDLGLNIFDGVRLFDVESNGLSSEGLHENLHSTSESENQMKGRFLLNVVILKGSAVF